MTASLDLWPIGNCQVSALIDRSGRFVWACAPRVDGDAVFSALLSGMAADSADARGLWEIALDGCVSIEQSYLHNTPILSTRMADANGNAIELIDFCPRMEGPGRTYRPVAFVRIVRPLSGSPRIRVRLRPTHTWGRADIDRVIGSNHIRYVATGWTLRLTTTAPVGMLVEERTFRLERPLHFFLGPDESFIGPLAATIEAMLSDTAAGWREWVRGLAIPPVGSSRVDLQACKLEYSIVSPK